MFRQFFKRACSFILLLMAHQSLLAQGVSVSARPSWVAFQQVDYNSTLKVQDVTNGMYYLLADLQNNINSRTAYYHYVEKILTNDGVQNASEISVSFNPEFQKLSFHEIKIIRGNEIIKALNLKNMKLVNVENDMERFVYRGTKTAMFILEDLRQGDVIEYSYSVQGNNPVFNNHYEDFYTMQYNEPLKQLYYRLVAPKNHKLYFKYFNGAEVPHVNQNGNDAEYIWNLNNVAAKFSDDDLPSWYVYKENVQVSEFETWHDVKTWAAKLFNVPVTSQRLDKIASEIGAKKITIGEKAIEAVDFVQNEIRYMGIEIGTHSHRPHTPEETLQKRYGDCKDKTVLLCALLKKLGIEASPVLISTSIKDHIKDFEPCASVFDHVVVRAKLNDKFYWIDGTISNQGGNLETRYFPDYRAGLLVDASVSDDVISIERHDCGYEILDEYFNVKDTMSAVELKVFTHYTNREADDIRNYFSTTSRDEIEKNYLNYYAKNYPEIKSIKPIEFYDNRLLDTILTIETYEITNQWQVDDSVLHKRKFETYAQGILDRLNTSATKIRTMPLGLSFPVSFEQNIVINLYEDWKVQEDKFSVRNDGLVFDYLTTYNNKTIRINYKYHTLKDFVEASKTSSYIKDLDKISNALGYKISIGNASPTKIQGAGINWIMALLALLFALIFSYIALKIYHYNNFIPFADDEEPALGGVLIFMGIGLVFTPIIIIYLLLSQNYFDHATWLVLTNPESEGYNPLWAPGLLFEVFGNVVLLVLSVLCVILLFKRRNIFPMVAIGFYSLNLAFCLIDAWLTSALNLSFDSSLITRPLLGAAIFIPYLLMADRVKSTFIMPSKSAMKTENVFVYTTAPSEQKETPSNDAYS